MKRNLKGATLAIVGAGSSNSVTVKLGDGNITWNEKTNIEYVMNQSVIDSARLGDEVPCEVSFDAIMEYIKSTTGNITVYDAIKVPTGWSTATGCEPPAIDLILTLPACGSNVAEIITFSDFRQESLNCDVKAGTISCSGKIPATAPVITKSA